ncbi:bifunctional 4-hydroxy-2-oxoglutarate aldolase/2-dehydro-3-deoxy-phosphogluconate aldolase [Kiloniella laminariae]|uniref:Bifunctional 4-hydroxy-2-oxoglutarate aldolase/2-dehydro-3-deoxy-phosphogluconate aldolase n=1 Tax=Kiloniella laminariae TaxID=454162 RepID=A0ABT4LQX1_9PROT|nr:bifunctional 4-hydroxy-2-oxoglutarate aldolase/2-dehydro-3-deoxy-phosphogluconate aldolase [Kiloniella laminariae]MCZ4282721.1 bifunctional 4-hydroxy-2-oxoglutarate aldolase/2-dehydro-3-deoxy-phosphogluconate aldolase [Kiloniella laminariae]
MSNEAHYSYLSTTLEKAVILPVLVIESSEEAVSLAQALFAGGCTAIEVTLRSQAALSAIEKIARALPELALGAGTLLEPAQFEQVKSAGASYALSPGTTPRLSQAAIDADLPYVPAAATPSEVLVLREQGFKIQKLFPATVVGGIDMLKSLHAPISDVRFCPTGGVSLDNLQTFLSQPNVICVGGSWLAPKNLVADKKWDEITKLVESSLSKANS